MEDVVSEIRIHFSNIDLDIRKSKFSRFMDQKNTPDVVSFIADCIINYIRDDSDTTFTVKDIWKSQYFIKNIRHIYNKPSPENINAKHEYDKFIGQPLRMLYYSRLLSSVKIGNTNHYKCKQIRFLQYISTNEKHSYHFLFEYVYSVMRCSGFLHNLEDFRKNNNDFSYNNLKKNFQKFMLGNTEIKNIKEINRIFPKIVNIFAVEWRIKGSVSGRLSKNIFYFSDLTYNETNFRDKEKSKDTPRRSSIMHLKIPTSKYNIQKAKNIIKRIHHDVEIKDRWSTGDPTQIHHIFSKNEYPQFAADIENLIRLTPTQHFTKAHPKNKTSIINKSYQFDLIIAKSYSIENSLKRQEPYYDQGRFIEILNECLDTSIDKKSTMEDVRIIIGKLM